MEFTQAQQNRFDSLSMHEKIAILFIQLGEEITTNLFSYMDINSIEEITKGIALAKSIDKVIANAVIEEFYTIFQSNSYLSAGGLEYAKELLYKVLPPEEAKKVLDRLARSLQKHENFSYLGKIKPQQLAEFIITEHPQTVALIVAHMDSSTGAEVMKEFPDELRAEIAIRMANLGEISPSIVRQVSKMLEVKLESFAGSKVEVGGTRAVAELFNRLGAADSKTTLTYIEQIDDKLSESIKDMMFTFEDIIKLDNKAIVSILGEVETKDLALGLKTATPALSEKFTSNMSQRAGDAFKEEIEFLGPQKISDVEQAQRKVVEVINAMAEKGELELGEQEEMV